MASDALRALRDHLESMFQFENNDLDFGIYKVLRLKQKEVAAFLDQELGAIVAAELRKATQGAADAQFQKLASYVREEKGQKYHALVYSPETVAENREELQKAVAGADDEAELLAAIEGTGGVDPEMEDRVYNHLLAFFGRYYRGGDFGYNDRSLATYKVDYPAPEADYDGSDVLLHWKHKGSYYIKTANGFPSVRFEVDGEPLAYRLETGGEADAQARTRNNNKDDGRKHYALERIDKTSGEDGQDDPVWRVVFRLAERSTPKADVFAAIMERVFGSAEGLDDYLYRPAKKGETRGKPAFNDLEGDYNKVEHGGVKGQGQLRLALETYLNAIAGHERFKGLGSNNDKRKAALEKDETVQRLHALDRHLNRFYVGVDADYFVHKDLGGFLRREAGRYVKDVVLSDVEGLLAEERDETAFLVARAFYRVAEKIIAFLAATEDFQKNLFLLKKKVIRTDWLVSLGKLAEWIADDKERAALLAEIHGNDAQRADWKATFGVEVADPNQLLLTHPTLPIDTRHFGEAFARRLLARCPNVEAETTGLLLNAENLQALRLLAATYRGKVHCIYIDPPYNTGGDGFLYKDAFRHSSWLSMFSDRLEEGRDFLSDNGALFVSIDDTEQVGAVAVVKQIFGSSNFLTSAVWEGGIKNDSRFLSISHDYIVVALKNIEALTANGTRWRTRKEGVDEIYTQAKKLAKAHGDEFPAISAKLRAWYRTLPKGHPAKAHKHYKEIDENGVFFPGDISWPGGGGPRYEVLHPVTKKPVVVPKSGWRFSKPETMAGMIEDNRVFFGADETTVPTLKRYLHETEGQVLPSVFYKDRRASFKELRDILGDDSFTYPKDPDVLLKLFEALGDQRETVLDFFAGSGTTGHAVLKLNKEDGGNRRFLLVEMGTYFERVLLERIRRVMYTLDWKDGRPKGAPNGTVGLVKVQALEGYEDVLDALVPEGEEVPEGIPLKYLYRPQAQAVRSSLDLTQPFSNRVRVGKGGDEAAVDVLETYAYLQGFSIHRLGAHATSAGGEIRWFRSGRHLVAFRDVRPGEDDADDLLALIDSQEGVEVLHVNAYADERRFAERAVALRLVTASDFDRGTAWS